RRHVHRALAARPGARARHRPHELVAGCTRARQGMSGPLRVGVVGYGLGGRTFHVPVARAAGLEISHVATSNPQRVAQAREEVPEARIVASLAELLAEAEPPDVVVLTSPSGLHATQAHEVIDAELPVVVDKPL